jgi:hypothetical protein
MVEETTVIRQLSPKRTQSGHDSFLRPRPWHEPTLISNTQRRQPETSGGDAADKSGITGAGIASILDQAGFGIRLFPKKLEVGFLQIV